MQDSGEGEVCIVSDTLLKIFWECYSVNTCENSIVAFLTPVKLGYLFEKRSDALEGSLSSGFVDQHCKRTKTLVSCCFIVFKLVVLRQR